MEIFELAKLLGEAIKKDIRLIEFEEAKKAYENDVELQNALKEYEVQQLALQSEMVKDEKDSFTIDSINERINSLYEEIVTNASFVRLNQLQVEVNELMNEVNNTITCAITHAPHCEPLHRSQYSRRVWVGR